MTVYLIPTAHIGDTREDSFSDVSGNASELAKPALPAASPASTDSTKW